MGLNELIIDCAMTDLIKIHTSENRQLVDARELHAFLENKRQFSDWIKQRIDQYGFIENHDYIGFSQNSEKPYGGRPSFEYGLTLDMAKELSMVENNEKGKIARRYFIQKEKEALISINAISRKDLAMMLYESEVAKERLEVKVLDQQKALEDAAPKVLFADCVTASKDTVLIRNLSAMLRQRGINIGQNPLFEWMRDNGYLCKGGTSYNHPTQMSLDLGLFELIPRTIGDPGHEMVRYTTYVTGKGLTYFVNKFLFNQR